MKLWVLKNPLINAHKHANISENDHLAGNMSCPSSSEARKGSIVWGLCSVD